MKFEFFQLTPYRELPADFPDRYSSVWVDIPSELFDPARAHEMFNDALDELEAAARSGYDGVCVNEHHQNGYGMMPSPNLMAATLTRRTRDVAIIVLGNSIALYNPPIRVAEEIAMLDCMSGGRMVSGFPVGTGMDDNYGYGINPSQLRERYYEAEELIMKAWTTPEMFSFNGKFTQLRYVNIWPRPVQEPHPPIWIPGGGSVETWEWCAEKGYVYCALSYGGYKAGKKNTDGFWNVMQSQERPLNPYHLGFLQLVAVGDSEQEVADKFGPHAEYFYNKMLHIDPRYTDPPGYRTLRTIEDGFGRSQGLKPIFGESKKVEGEGTREKIEAGKAKEITWADLLREGNIVAGTPKQVTEQLEEVIDTLHVGHLMILNQFGSVPKEIAIPNIEKTAREVLPKLRHIWDDEGWEDKWWPQSLAKRVEPAALS
jgi:alkanesulfonate monooxygenase SsuD/methylene tetrahydromethanopterin reductase-like flavin-dependent oxidoreductase (luciferase family)